MPVRQRFVVQATARQPSHAFQDALVRRRGRAGQRAEQRRAQLHEAQDGVGQRQQVQMALLVGGDHIGFGRRVRIEARIPLRHPQRAAAVDVRPARDARQQPLALRGREHLQQRREGPRIGQAQQVGLALGVDRLDLAAQMIGQLLERRRRGQQAHHRLAAREPHELVAHGRAQRRHPRQPQQVRRHLVQALALVAAGIERAVVLGVQPARQPLGQARRESGVEQHVALRHVRMVPGRGVQGLRHVRRGRIDPGVAVLKHSSPSLRNRPRPLPPRS